MWREKCQIGGVPTEKRKKRQRRPNNTNTPKIVRRTPKNTRHASHHSTTAKMHNIDPKWSHHKQNRTDMKHDITNHAKMHPLDIMGAQTIHEPTNNHSIAHYAIMTKRWKHDQANITKRCNHDETMQSFAMAFAFLFLMWSARFCRSHHDDCMIA